jgi:hypothetical protein
VAEQNADAAPGPLLPRSPWASPWTVAALGVVLAAVLSAAVLPAELGAVNPPFAVVAFALALVAAEWFSLRFEFRRQSFSTSASELVFVMALVEIGGAWTAVARAAAVGVALLA